MKIVSIDPMTFALEVSCERADDWQIPARLVSLVMVAVDCQVPSIACELPKGLPRAVRSASEEFIARNSIVTLESSTDRAVPWVEPGHYVVGMSEAFFCLGDTQNDRKYSLFMAGTEDNVDRATRCAYILAVALGFSSNFSFEIRLGVYELLMNVVEHGLKSSSRDWIQVDLEREGEMLLVSIVDRGIAFNPVGDSKFDLQGYVGGRKTRGLGLIMTRRIAEHLTHRRESGYNKTFMKKSVWSRGTPPRDGKETSVAQFEIGGPAPLGDGSHMLTLSGDLDAKGALIVERMIGQLLEKNVFRVALDFEKVSFISSAGVGILLALASSMRDAGGDAVFVRIPPKVKSVFQLLNLEDYFTIRDSVAADA